MGICVIRGALDSPEKGFYLKKNLASKYGCYNQLRIFHVAAAPFLAFFSIQELTLWAYYKKPILLGALGTCKLSTYWVRSTYPKFFCQAFF
jgi:hypothetical protein